MTPDLAIEKIQEFIDCDGTQMIDIVTLITAQDALRKQIPLAVSAEEPCHVKALDVDTMQVLTYECYPCPSCRKWIHANITIKYCQHCGQALDWRDRLGI